MRLAINLSISLVCLILAGHAESEECEGEIFTLSTGVAVCPKSFGPFVANDGKVAAGKFRVGQEVDFEDVEIITQQGNELCKEFKDSIIEYSNAIISYDYKVIGIRQSKVESSYFGVYRNVKNYGTLHDASTCEIWKK